MSAVVAEIVSTLTNQSLLALLSQRRGFKTRRIPIAFYNFQLVYTVHVPQSRACACTANLVVMVDVDQFNIISIPHRRSNLYTNALKTKSALMTGMEEDDSETEETPRLNLLENDAKSKIRYPRNKTF